MTAPYRKKLIEVSLPLAAINAESAREKSIRHGHPSTLHLWWARRPLAACRAVLFASLVDDPDSDPQYRKADGSVDEERAGIKRADLFNLIEELVAWENSNNADVIRSARVEIARCVASRKVELKELDPKLELAPKVTVRDLMTHGHCRPKSMGLDKEAGRVRFAFDVSNLPPSAVVNKFLAEHAPPVLDPFAGGGSIPLEAKRLGLRAYASDLNPVPVLINKALIEIPSKFAGRPPVNPESCGDGSGKAKRKKSLIERDWRSATGLAEDVRYYSKWMRDEAEKRIGHLYPKVKITPEMADNRPDLKEYVNEDLTVIAWLWARTIQCPNPACRARTPLVRSFWLSTKKGKSAFALPRLDQDKKSVSFEIALKGEPPKHTTDRTGARCLFCDTFIKKAPLREIAIEHGVSEIPLAVVAEGTHGRIYLNGDSVPTPNVPKPSTPFLDQPMTNDKRWFSPPLYGLPNFSDLFTHRQLIALTTFSDLVAQSRDRIRRDALAAGLEDDNKPLAEGGVGAAAYADAVATYLGIGIDKAVDYNCTLVTWIVQRDQAGHAMTKQALPMVWDYVEVNPFVGAAGDPTVSLAGIARVIESMITDTDGDARQLDATASMNAIGSGLISTDPPYYDNIGYADLSDFFYIWLRHSLSSIYPSLFATLLTPKAKELIASAHRHDGQKDKAQQFFEHGLGLAFGHMHQAQASDYPLTVYYAFKQSETDEDDSDDDSVSSTATASTGWETMLAGLIRSGFSIHGTWPMRTERSVRSVGLGTNALASSIILVCRPRLASARSTTRKEFITSLRKELPEALRDLQAGSIAPVDMAQSAIGPGMAIFTRYSTVMETDGSPMSVRTALGMINQVLDEVLAEQEGEFDSDTRWALAWFDQFGMKEEAFGVAETLSKAKNTAVNGLVEAGVISAKSGKVRLLKRDELPEDWDPKTDRRLTVWESVQHLIRVLETQGEEAAGDLVKKLGSQAETCRDLAYRLYSVCERKKWAEEALAYNGLVIAWPELVRLSLASDTRPRETQAQLFS